jgi:hypothetical protein
MKQQGWGIAVVQAVVGLAQAGKERRINDEG